MITSRTLYTIHHYTQPIYIHHSCTLYYTAHICIIRVVVLFIFKNMIMPGHKLGKTISKSPISSTQLTSQSNILPLQVHHAILKAVCPQFLTLLPGRVDARYHKNK